MFHGEGKHMGYITEASHNQLEELTRIALELYTGNEFEELQAEVLEMLKSTKHHFLLYYDSDHLVGFMHLSIREDYVEGSVASPTGYLEGVYVKPELRRNGISTKLFHEGKKWLLEKGCTQIGSDTEIDNQDSYHLHMGLGFKEANRLITFIQDLK
jgi:aminoglycoside 6'-N-acetyltransferase I